MYFIDSLSLQNMILCIGLVTLIKKPGSNRIYTRKRHARMDVNLRKGSTRRQVHIIGAKMGFKLTLTENLT